MQFQSIHQLKQFLIHSPFSVYTSSYSFLFGNSPSVKANIVLAQNFPSLRIISQLSQPPVAYHADNREKWGIRQKVTHIPRDEFPPPFFYLRLLSNKHSPPKSVKHIITTAHHIAKAHPLSHFLISPTTPPPAPPLTHTQPETPPSLLSFQASLLISTVNKLLCLRLAFHKLSQIMGFCECCSQQGLRRHICSHIMLIIFWGEGDPRNIFWTGSMINKRSHLSYKDSNFIGF